MKILHLPYSIGGLSWGLAQGERMLGCESDVLIASQSGFHSQSDICLGLENSKSYIGKTLKLFRAFLKYRNKYDVFHFNYGSSLIHSPRHYLNQFDLPFYPKRAKIFATYQGCDARQKFPTMKRTAIAPCHNPSCYAGQCNSGKLDVYRRMGIEKMSGRASHIFAVNPDLLHFLPPEKSSFLPYALSPKGIAVKPPNFEASRLKIVHAPTNREGKGSKFILEAFERLRHTHPGTAELIVVEGIPHREALKVYADADLIVDQILVGWYGGFAVETMRMGKPVVVRIAETDLKFLPIQMAFGIREAAIHAEPTTIYDTLVRCIEDRSFLKRKAEASLAYVNRWHDLKYVAGLTREKYEAAMNSPAG